MLNTKQKEYQDELNKLKNLSFRYAQKYPDEVPNFYDKEIAMLYYQAMHNGVLLCEDGEMIEDHITILVKKANAQPATSRKKEL